MDDTRAKWNRRYCERGPGGLTSAPSEWLAAHQGELVARAHGTALDLACGTGRNALYLARLGFTVDALDISDVAIAQLTDAAALAGLAVHAREVDLEAAPLPPGPYEVVLVLNYLQRDLFTTVPAVLAPGGVVIAETVTQDHIEQLRRGFDPRFVLELGELRDSFAGLEVVHYAESVADRGGRLRAVASIVARRPG